MRWPAEWEPQEHIFIGWPDHAEEWGAALSAARQATIDLCRALRDPHTLYVARSPVAEIAARLSGVTTVRALAYGDVWLRDTGPVWLVGPASRRAVSFRWTGWGGKYVMAGDENVASFMAAGADADLVRSLFAGEGGGLETDGRGTCITTRDCLLNPNRNPGASARDIEADLGERLGVERTVWLDRGLLGDHTDGHVDNLARFVAPGVVAAAISDKEDPNYAVHREVREAIEAASLVVAPIPSPGRVLDTSGAPMPATHLNFTITNSVVAVPIFGGDSDDAALAAIGALFPTREVVGVDARALLYGGGALHCMSNHLPDLSCESSPA